MRHRPHRVRRAALWLVYAAPVVLGLLLLRFLPSHRLAGGIAVGFIALMVLKHLGLLLIVAPLLAGLRRSVRLRTQAFLRRYVCHVG